MEGGLVHFLVFRLLQGLNFVEASALFNKVADCLELVDLLATIQNVFQTVKNNQRDL